MTVNWLNRRFIDRPDSRAGEMDLPDALNCWRIEKLAETLRWASVNSPYYRQSLERKLVQEILAVLEAGPSPAEAGRALAALPFTRPAELSEDSLRFLAVAQDEVEGIVSVPTSGTSGEAKRIFSTAADLEETTAFFEYGMRILVGPGRDRVALAMSPARPGNVGDLLGRAMARHGIPFLAHGFVPQGPQVDIWLDELISWQPTCLVGVPPQMLTLSRNPRAGGLKALKSMLLSGDVAEDHLVAELEKNFPGCRVYRHYGLTECGLGGAVECGRRQWPHLRDDLWVEIVDQNGCPRPDGQSGEIVITPLSRRALPLLRYRTGDEGLILPACPCGALSPRLKVLGRLSDRLLLPDGSHLRVSDFEKPLFSLSFVRDYELRATAGGRLELAVSLSENPSEAKRRSISETIDYWLGPQVRELGLEIKIEDASSRSQNSELASGGKRRLIRPE